jgi:dihydropteroate synthase
MREGLYLRPAGLVSGDLAHRLVAEKAALWLAGGPLAFTGAMLVEGKPGATRDRYLDAAGLSQTGDRELRALIDRVTAPRGAFSGLPLDRPLLMGIVNVTPDSFSDGGSFARPEDAIAHGRALIEAGADILDIGGESTRPGSEAVPLAVERERVMPVLAELADRGVPLSIDTRKAALMAEAVRLGAKIINDVSALTYDAESAAIAAASNAHVVLMHSKGEPKTMQEAPSYRDVVLEVYDALAARLAAAEAAGIPRARLAVDPGIGFGKSFAHNLQIMEHLAQFHGLGVTLLIGASRKGFVGHVTGVEEAGARVYGSLGMALAAAAQGVQIQRVHDVAATRQALTAWRSARGIETDGAPADRPVRVAHKI